MELTEDLFTQSLEKLDTWLSEDFQVLSSYIKNVPEGKKRENSAVFYQLIELLQYHDLIRQKVQHVQGLNSILCEEVKREGRVTGFEMLTPELFMLMIELLRFSRQEYAKVVKKLRYFFDQVDLTDGWQEGKFRSFYQETLTIIYQMESLYTKIGEKQQRDQLQLIEAQEKMQHVYQSFSMGSEREIFKNLMKDHSQFKGIQQSEQNEEISGEIDLF